MSFSQGVILISYAGLIGGQLVAQARGDRHLLVPLATLNALTGLALVVIAVVLGR